MSAGAVFPQRPELFDPVAWWARVDGARIAVEDPVHAVRYSYRELDAHVSAWHVMLTQLGVAPGDRVAILAHNRYAFLPLLFACVRRGAVCVPLNWRLAAPELARVLADAQPLVCFGEEAFRATAEAAVRVAGTVRWVDLDRDLGALLRGAAAAPVPASPRRHLDDVAMLLYTSGSTGTPKGVVSPHRQLLWNALATVVGWQLGAGDVAAIGTPLFHTAAWHAYAMPVLWAGGRVVLLRTFDPATYLATLEAHRVSVVFTVPTQLALLQRASDWGRPLPALRTFLSGGAPCPLPTLRAVDAAGYAIRDGYGLTECGPNCFATTAETARTKAGGVGWPLPFLDVRLRVDDGHLAADDVPGELELRGPQLFGGYFRAPMSTAEVMTADGWLRTGDVAVRDGDGVYRVLGRRREMFISGGENVFPGEVEAALLDCPGVNAAVVVPIPDAIWGEVGSAVVVADGGASSAPDLLSALRQRLAGYKVPRRIRFVEQLPTLGTGKVDRHAVARLARDAGASDSP